MLSGACKLFCSVVVSHGRVRLEHLKNGFLSTGVLRTVYIRAECIMASWSSPQVENKTCLWVLHFFPRVPLQTALHLHDHPKWQVTRSECCVIERGILFMFFPWEGLRQTPDCASPSLTTTLTPGTQPGLWAPFSQVFILYMGSPITRSLFHFAGLLSFMLERSPTLGSVETSDYEKKQFALRQEVNNHEWKRSLMLILSRSLEFNLKSRIFNELFPELKKEAEEEVIWAWTMHIVMALC